MTVATQSAHELYQAAFAPHPELDAAEQTRLKRVVLATDLAAVVAGGWLLWAPFVLGYTAADRGPDGYWNTVATAGVVLLLAVLRAGRPRGALAVRTAGLLAGGWLFVAPMVLGAGTPMSAALSEVLTGLLLVAFALAGLRAAVVARRIA